ncbi:hypothetical protein TNCV_1801231 [Trichonephila clavipes]|nr:hypothetical protein TNCV_1801231 [Trichonephila clavipes]
MGSNDSKMDAKVTKLAANLVTKNDGTWLYRPDFSLSLNRHYNTDHQIGTSVHAPQRPRVTNYDGHSSSGPHGLLCH